MKRKMQLVYLTLRMVVARQNSLGYGLRESQNSLEARLYKNWIPTHKSWSSFLSNNIEESCDSSSD
ncbi:uncharacterized protein Eint_050105 [Encephalitozoon intestinalis ATCC 50506]|uniref:Uncharacterized protein n=1 Tax=Encephalitozoon intestinalis (strain ATCC 50506) TaxID=876142 RepID=W8Q1V1_ENCIT|nr:uncharacterized protein Eint_050105 [Encephalitozoon intestinalis ATCC 50506]AHL30099.1 hypothetical protein Eint_050105 [Encephalitozoon intestinalis ATCC 50506]UTX45170.1 hypothetical protein GPK93_05g07140 [Encephalitozoon intestinalis]